MTTRFDSIVHVTRDGTWLGGRRFDASLSRLQNEMVAAGVSRACLVAIAGHVDDEYMLEIAGREPDRFVPVRSLNPVESGTISAIQDTIRDYAKSGVRCVKLHPRLNGFDPLDKRCIAALNAAADADLVVYLDTLFRRRGMTTTNAPDLIDALANTCPETKLVLLHGGGSSVLDVSEVVRVHSNLTLDVSFTFMRYAGSSIDDDLAHLFSRFDQRIVLGSDFPEYSLVETYRRFEEMTKNLPSEKKENILFRNLQRLLAISS